ncbi:MAG: DUF2177 family protein [Thermotogota bacterium]
MFDFIKIYLTSFVVFFVIDLVWLGVVAQKLYAKHLGYIMKEKPDWIAAILFYLLYIIGLVFFVIQPALEKSSWQYALFAGLFFGFITYATYDLTNLATLKDWPLKITIIDLIWGSVLGASVSIITYSIIKGLNWIS